MSLTLQSNFAKTITIKTTERHEELCNQEPKWLAERRRQDIPWQGTRNDRCRSIVTAYCCWRRRTFIHSHKTHEELYVIISGKGEYEVDGEKTAVSEGTIIRVSPAGVRALRNTSDKDMVMMCIQYESKPITDFMEDANIIPLDK